jgi:hypothetical protein
MCVQEMKAAAVVVVAEVAVLVVLLVRVVLWEAAVLLVPYFVLSISRQGSPVGNLYQIVSAGKATPT